MEAQGSSQQSEIIEFNSLLFEYKREKLTFDQ